ncbi:MAG TPA: nitroreductase family protein [Mobilitalea sp.]|nr:nitroreductase family protein [Mobilitalea sp.]
MDLYKAIDQRRTIRDLQDKELPTELIEKIINAGLKAPTNDHLRSWEFVVFTDKEEKAELIHKIPKKFTKKQVEAFLDRYQMTDSCQREMYTDGVPKQYSMLYHSGCIILPFFRQDGPILKPKSINDLNGFASIWCCIENIFLAAAAEGLGAAFRIPFAKETKYLQELIGHPDNYVMPCYIALGYPMENAVINSQHVIKAKDRIHKNKW